MQWSQNKIVICLFYLKSSNCDDSASFVFLFLICNREWHPSHEWLTESDDIVLSLHIVIACDLHFRVHLWFHQQRGNDGDAWWLTIWLICVAAAATRAPVIISRPPPTIMSFWRAGFCANDLTFRSAERRLWHLVTTLELVGQYWHHLQKYRHLVRVGTKGANWDSSDVIVQYF